MEILRYLLIVIEVLCCLMLIGVILLQQSKSQGMGMAFGGGMGESLFGSRAGNVLTKITVILGLVFLANTTLLGIMYTSRSEDSLVESAPAPAPLPVAPSAPVDAGGLLTATPSEPAPLLTPGPVETVAMEAEPVPVEIATEPPAVEVAPVVVEEVAAPVDAEPAPATP